MPISASAVLLEKDNRASIDLALNEDQSRVVRKIRELLKKSGGTITSSEWGVCDYIATSIKESRTIVRQTLYKMNLIYKDISIWIKEGSAHAICKVSIG